MPGGRIAVLSYHSGEDRIVKDRFARPRPVAATARPGCRACAARCRRCASSAACRSGRGRPSATRNRRAASARLRVAEKIDPLANADRTDR